MENDSENTEANSSKSLKYLTVQDILWINLQATKKVQHFRYALLEEATFYQYGYGASRNLALQAGRFLHGFMKLHPLDAGNEATAFIGCAAFLILNGSRLKLTDDEATGWLAQVRSGQVRPEEALPIVESECHGHSPKVAEAVNEVLDQYPKTISALAKLDETRAAS
jgi:prophage maintenance system killer protein